MFKAKITEEKKGTLTIFNVIYRNKSVAKYFSRELAERLAAKIAHSGIVGSY